MKSLSFLFLLALAVAAPAQTFTVTDLGALNGSPTYATAINDHGVISGFSQPTLASARAWIWKNGTGFTDVGSLGGSDNRGLAVGVDDRLYGYLSDAAELQHGFVWDGATLSDLGYLATGDAVLPQAVNAGGVITGYTNTAGTTLGFKITSGVMSALGTLPGADVPATSAAYDINDAGQIVGVASWIGGGTRAFRTDVSGALVSLGTLGANDSFATAINSAGQVAGYSTNASNVMHAFFYADGAGMRDLGVLPGGAESRAYGMDDSGSVVGASSDAAGNSRAFLWMPGAMRDLNDLIPPNSGWVLNEARDVNNSGDIVGYGTINGSQHAFLLERFEGPDTFAPVATATVTPPGQGATVTQVAVKFWDDQKVVSATARATGAIRITGPNAYDAGGTASSWTTNDSQVVNVSFNVPAPGGTWTPDDNGTYEVRVAPNVVSDLAGNRHPGGVIATFTVGLQTTPTFSITSAPVTATVGVPVSFTFAATSSYPSAVSDVFAFTIDWDGDGTTVETVSGTTNSIIAHTFTSTGSRTVRAHATDPHGVVSTDRTSAITVANTTASLQPSEVLGTPSGTFPYATVATEKAGTMYFFGQPFTAAANTGVFTWNYLTPGAGFVTQPDNLDNGPIQPAGAAVDSRGRILFFGGGEAGAAGSGANTYTLGGGLGGGVTAMPAAVASGITTTDNLTRVYFFSDSLYRYTAGTTGNGTWATLPGPGVALSCLSFDGGDRIIGFAGTAVWAYSISGNVWTQLGTAPVAPGRAALGADGLVYLISPSQVWAFDPVANTISLVGTTTYNQAYSQVLKGTDGYLYLIGSIGVVERFDTRATTTQAPRISSTPPSTTIVQGTAWSYAVAASGKPRPTFSLVHAPAGMTINSTTGLVSWTPALAQVGAQTAVVRATNSGGMAEQMITFNVLTVAPDVTAPTAPGNVTVLPPPQLTTNSADITWTASTDNVGVTGYGIYVRRARYGGRGSSYRIYYSQIASTTALTWHFANLPLCSTSTYYIAAVDAAGNRSAYSPVTIKVLCVPTIYGTLGGYAIEDEAYTSGTMSATGNPVPTLTQTGMPAGAVWHSTAGNAGYFTWTPAFGQGADANYTPPTQPAVPGTATFTLTASNLANGGSAVSTTQSYTLPVWPKGTDLIPPAPVPGVAVNSIMADSAHVSWLPTTDNYGIAAYRVTAAHRPGRSRFHRGPYVDHIVTVDLPATATDVTLTGLRPSTSYVITVIARDLAGVSAPGVATGLWSYPSSAPVIYTRPLAFAVSNVQQTANANGSMTISWPNQGYYWQYTVQCTDSLSPANWQPVPPVSQWPSYYINSFTFTSDPNVPQRFYRVYATPGL